MWRRVSFPTVNEHASVFVAPVFRKIKYDCNVAYMPYFDSFDVNVQLCCVVMGLDVARSLIFPRGERVHTRWKQHGEDTHHFLAAIKMLGGHKLVVSLWCIR